MILKRFFFSFQLIFALSVVCNDGLYAVVAAYVANSTSNDVTVVDTTTNTAIITIPVSANPLAVAATPDGSLVYVACTAPATFNVIETATNTVIATVSLGTTLTDVATATTGAGTFAYFADPVAGAIYVIATSNNAVVATIAAPGAVAIDTSSVGGIAYYIDGSNSAHEIDLSTNTITATILVGAIPLEVALNSTGSLAFVSIVLSANRVNVIDTATNSIIATISLPGAGPNDLAVTPDNALLYVCARTIDRVLVIDLAGFTVIATIPVGDAPEGIAITSDGTLAYVTNLNSDTVSVIDLATNSVIATVPVGGGPTSVTIPTTVPYTLRGEQINNRFLTQSDLVNIITWSAPPNFTPVFYQIFRDAALTDLAGTVSASSELKFEDHNRRKKQIYVYFVIAVDQNGNRLNLGGVTVFPNS